MIFRKLILETVLDAYPKEKISGKGYVSDVYPLGKDKVVKIIKNPLFAGDENAKKNIKQVYFKLSKRPDLFGKIKIIKDYIIQERFDTKSAQEKLRFLSKFSEKVIANKTGEMILPYFRFYNFISNYVTNPNRLDIEEIQTKLKKHNYNQKFCKELLDFFVFLEEVRIFCIDAGWAGLKSDLHDENFAIDKNGNWKVIDIINPETLLRKDSL